MGGCGGQELSVMVKSAQSRPAFLAAASSSGMYFSGSSGALQVSLQHSTVDPSKGCLH